MADDDLVLPNFSEADLEAIRAEVGAGSIPVEPVANLQPLPIKRKRGRPRKYPRPETTPSNDEPESGNAPPSLLSPAPLTKRDEREVASRLSNILTGATGMGALAKPYLQMTDEEAKAIADPLSSYLVRNADTIPVARQVLENYDLLAITLGVMAYVVRVYHDRSVELSEQAKRNGPGAATIKRVQESAAPSQRRPEVRDDGFISAPYGSGDGVGTEF